MKKNIYLGIFTTALFFLNACLTLTKDFPEKKSYLIEVNRAKPSSNKIRNVNLKLRKVSVSNKFEGKGFVYRKSESNYESDFYNEFLVSPQSNLSEEIIRYLSSREIFENVSGMGSRMEATHYLEAEFTELYGDYRKKNQSKAVLSVQFRIFDDRLGDYRMVKRKTYSSSIQVKSDSPESLVAGWNQGLENVLRKISKDFYTVDWSLKKLQP